MYARFMDYITLTKDDKKVAINPIESLKKVYEEKEQKSKQKKPTKLFGNRP